jgi:hypothetical protein
MFAEIILLSEVNNSSCMFFLFALLLNISMMIFQKDFVIFSS